MTKLLFSLTAILVVSMVLPVYGQIAPAPVLNVKETFQGTNILAISSIQSASWLEWNLIYQDGTETGTTKRIASTFSTFPAFVLSFAPEAQNYRTLIVAEVRNIVDYSKIGTGICYSFPSVTINQVIMVNGQVIDIPKQRFGSNNLNTSTQILEGTGIKFTPQLIERFLGDKGITLKSGDVVTWNVSFNNRFTAWQGQISSISGLCGVTGATAFDVYATGMVFQSTFVFLDPIDQLLIPTTDLPDLDGDGIPDVDDLCDFSPERFNGFQDEDGCPDLDPVGFDPTTITDQDGDGIIDEDDLCINQPEIFNGIEDGDGCPDGAILDVGFGAVPITEPIIALEDPQVTEPELPTFGEIISGESELDEIMFTDPIIEPIVDPIPVDDIILLEEQPESMIHVSVDSEPVGNAGTTNSCGRDTLSTTEDCNEVIFQAIRNFEQTTGIQLPFQPTLLNLILIFAGIVGVILIMILFIRRR